MKHAVLKRGAALLLILAMALAAMGLSPALAQGTADWPAFRKDAANNGIVDVKTARDADEVSVKWAKSFTGGSMWASMGSPIIVGDNIYVSVNNTIKKIDKNTGEELASGSMVSRVGFFSFACYGDGMLFVPVGGRLQAFDADTLESLWVTEATNYQTNAPVIYDSGRVYMGLTNGSASEGKFFCVDAADEDTTTGDEIKSYLWEDGDSACYWAGAAIVGDAVIYGNDAGLLQSRNKVTGALIDSLQADSNIRSSVAYDEATGNIYFTAKDAAKVYGVSVNGDGSFDKATLRSGAVQGLTTTTPVVYNGRVYVTSGSMDDPKANAITVLDSAKLEKIYEASLGGICQASPLLTTAYATEGNKNTVYLYVTLNTATSEIKVIRDYEGNTEADVNTLYVPETEFQQYCTHSLICDGDGTIYHKNDGGNLIALAASPSEALTAVDQVTDQIQALKEITSLDQKDAVAAARAAYDGLSDDQKAMVLNADVLTAAEAKIAELEAMAKQDQQAAQTVIDQIKALGEITGLDQKDAAAAARAAYDALTDAQKAYVDADTLKILTDAEDKIAELEKPQDNQSKTEGETTVTGGTAQKTAANVGTGIFSDQSTAGAAAVLGVLSVLGGVVFLRYRRQR